MNKILVVISTVIVGIALFAGGAFFAQVNAQEGQPGESTGNWDGAYGPGMMGNWDGEVGADMMNGGMMNMTGSSMMGSYGSLEDVNPLSIEDAETAVTDYLATLNNETLTLGEIMIFDNHAYAQIMNSETGQGAFEVLVDPTTQNVFPEPGPNMMWNTEYGMMAGFGGGMMGGQYSSDMMNGQFGSGMMGGSQYGNMMGSFGYAPDAEINITAEEAIDAAQEYLDTYLSGKTADERADTFPGYYTLHFLEDGETIGMLSVNAYTGQVFLHHWHGEFIEMVGEAHD